MPVTFKHSPPLNVRKRLHLEWLEDRWVPANFDVTNLNDAGAGSLRAAITAANNVQNANEAVTITFAANNTGTITLQTELPPITKSKVTITGTGVFTTHVVRDMPPPTFASSRSGPLRRSSPVWR
jgi:hypothetical protein